MTTVLPLHRAALAALALAAAAPGGVRAEEPHRPVTVGADVDLVPIGVTVATRDSGFGAALWVGRWKDRLRLTTTIEHHPETTREVTPQPTGNTLFRRYEATRVGLSYDRFLWTEFRGPWAGAGVEVGWVSLGSASGTRHTNQVNPGAALAVGWIVRPWRGLSVSPSASLHGAVTRAVVLEGERRREHQLWGALSLSVGWSERIP